MGRTVNGVRRCLLSATTVTLVLGLLAGACAPATPPPDVTDPGDSTDLQWLTAVRGPSAGIYDESGRQVMLRGVNFNHLGDYFQSHPDLPTVATLDDADWDDAAAQGMNVIRLVTNWSAWEPERDVFDRDYLERVRDAVDQANAHGMYVVIDMHQDAWSKFVYTPAEEVCPPGTTPQIGWDGAPEWATFTDGAPTCSPARREDSPAVKRAWAAFYANREGIRDELAELWGQIAAEFADHPGVAGFDLLNEPGYSFDQDATLLNLAQFYRSAIGEIRAAERMRGARPHVIFFETTVNGPFVALDFSDDPHLVFAPHNYGESIGPSLPGLLELLTDALRLLAALYGTTTWIGEYGNFSPDPVARTTYMSRFNRLQDRAPGAGGTWWQWEQTCGDPHDVASAYPPSDEWVAQQLPKCDESARMAMPCTARSYPRAVPGRLVSLRTEPCGGPITVTGITPAPSTAELWLHGERPEPPPVSGSGVGAAKVEPRPGGYRVTVPVAGDYRIEVG